MKKQILTAILIIVIVFSSFYRLSFLGWLFIFGIGSVCILTTIHLIVHTKLIPFSNKLGGIDLILIISSHLLYALVFLCQYDFDDSKTYGLFSHIINKLHLKNYGEILDWLPLYLFASYLIVTIILIFRIRNINPAFTRRKISVTLVLIFSITIVPIAIIYAMGIFRETQNTDKEESMGRYENLNRALKSINQVKYLRLYSYPNSYTEIPEGVSKLINLEELEMYSNEIRFIPGQIAHLKKLRRLDLQYNKVEEIPDEISALKNLEELNLLDDSLKSINPKICECTSLKKLSVSGLRLNHLPECLKSMANLESLTIQSDSIYSMFNELEKFKHLKELQIFIYRNSEVDKVKYNQLKDSLPTTNVYF